MTEEQLRAAMEDYDAARKARDAAIARASREGMRQVDICRVTGFTREHVRRLVRAAGQE